ncbi:MAG TPA: peptidoglycan-binding domain-containing protein [Terriglobia bacterium]|nr:peptidoglycan-binding domain-containing protein [Terriglobia bacterium]
MRLTSNYEPWIRCTIATAIGLFLLPALRLDARQKRKGHPAEKHTVNRDIKSNDQPVKRHYTHHDKPQTTQHHYAHHQNTLRHKKHPRYFHRSRRGHHLPLVRLQPERVTEIQQALVRTGYLQEAPTGKWDAATRDAMQRYQQANGFRATGLPEAKPIMKLGLGPHPLPPSLQPLRSASASIPSETEASTSPSAPAPSRASSQAQ